MHKSRSEYRDGYSPSSASVLGGYLGTRANRTCATDGELTSSTHS